MKNYHRISSAVTAILLHAASLTACGGAAETPIETQTEAADTAAVTEPAEVAPVYEPDDLPEELDFGGVTSHIFGWEGDGEDIAEFFVEEADGDVVNDAIYDRNRTVEERLNLTLTYTLIPGNNSNRGTWTKTVSQSTLAGDGANDIVAGYSMCGATLANKRLLTDLMELDYLNFDKPWWPDSLIREATCGGKLYFCSGDISTYMIYYLFATFFNKTLVQNYDIENPYELVRNGQWTLDKLISISTDVYSDINGDGKKDAGDQFGYATHCVWADSLFFAADLRTTETGSDGIPVLSQKFGGEKTQALLTTLIDMFASNGMFLGLNGDDYDVVRNQFLENRSMFITTQVCFANSYLRHSDVEYGILPLPKYDETQQDYYTVASFPYTLYGIPVDAKDPAMSAALLECLASESYRTVSPALFEIALKVKYAGDDDASEMYDIIRASNVFDFGRIFNDNLSSATYSLFRQALVDGNKNWISTYEKNAKNLAKQLEKVVNNLTKEE